MENKRRNIIRWGIFLVSLSLFGLLIFITVQRSVTQAEGGGDECTGDSSNCQYLDESECVSDPVCHWATGEGSYCTDQALCSELGETDCINSSICEWSGGSGSEGDTVGPVFNFTTSVSGDTDANPLYVGDASDASSNVSQITYSIDGGSEFNVYSEDYGNPSASFSHQFSGLPLGSHSIDFIAYDSAGNLTTQTFNINVIDNAGPNYTFYDSDSGDTDPDVLYFATATDPSDVAAAYYSLDGAEPIYISGGYGTSPADVFFEIFGLSEGSHTLEVIFEDGLGNTSTETFNLNVIIPDTTPPVLNFTAYEGSTVDGDYTPSPKRIEYEWTATDSENNIASAKITKGGFEYSWDSADGTFDELTEEFAYGVSQQEGLVTIIISVSDSAGNEASETFYLDVDTVMPFCELSNHERETSDTVISYTANCTDNDPLELPGDTKVEYSVYHSEIGNITSPEWIEIPAPDDGTFDETEEDVSFTTPVLPDGNVTVLLKITDKSGNDNNNEHDYEYGIATDALRIEARDDSAPNSVLHEVRPDPITITQPVITGGCKDDHITDTNSNIASMKYKVDTGSWVEMQPLDGSFDEPVEEFSQILPELTIGSHTVYIQCEDSAQPTAHSSESSDTFEIISHSVINPDNTITIEEPFDNQVRNANNYDNPGIWGNGRLRLKETLSIESQEIKDSENFGERYKSYNSWLDMHQAEDGTIWYTKKGSFGHYDPETDSYTTYSLTDYGLDAEVAETKKIETINFNDKLFVWVATSHGLLILNETDGTYVVYENTDLSNLYNSHDHDGVHTVVIDRRGNRNAAYVTVVTYNSEPLINSKMLYIDIGTDPDPSNYSDDFAKWIPSTAGLPMDGADEVNFHPSDDNYIFMRLYGTGIALIQDNNDPQNFGAYTNVNYTNSYLQTVTDWNIDQYRNIRFISFFGEYGIVERDGSKSEMDLSGDTVTLLANKDLLLQKSIDKMYYIENSGVSGNQSFFITGDEIIYFSDNGTITNLDDDTIIFNDPNPVYSPNALEDIIIYDNSSPSEVIAFLTMRRGLYKITLNRGWEDTNQGVGLVNVPDSSYQIADHFKLNASAFAPVASPTDPVTSSSIDINSTQDTNNIDSGISINSFEGVSFDVSVDDGITWTPTNLNDTHSLGEQDNRLRFRVNLSELSGNQTPVLDLVNLGFSAYSTETQQAPVSIEIQTQPPSSVKVNNTFNFTVRAIDALGNTAINYNEAGSLSLRLASATSSAVDALNFSNIQFTDGVAQVNGARISQTGDYVIHVTSGSHETTTNQINVYDELAGDTEVLPKLSFWADKYRIRSGETVELQWSSENLHTLNLSQATTDLGNVDLQGSRNVTLTRTTTFTLQGYGDYGNLQSSLTISVYDGDDDEACIIPEITVDPEEIVFSPGERVSLNWEIKDADYAYINYPEKTDIALLGSQEFYPEDEATIIISAYNGTKEEEADNTCFSQKEIPMHYRTDAEAEMLEFTEGDLEDQGAGDNYQRSIVNGANFPPEAPLITAITLTAFTAGGIAWFSGIMQGLRYIGVLLGFLFPRKKKYWGIVFDENESKGIPFASVRLYKYTNESDGNGKIIKAQAVTDEKGRYGLLVEGGSGKYQIEVKASGYQGVTKQITLNSSLQEKEIVEDFPLLKEGETSSFLRRLFLYRRQDLFKVMRLIMFVLMLGGFIYTLLITRDNPVPFNYALLIIYAILFALNLIIIVRGREKFTGRVVDKDTNQGIRGVSLRIYKDSKQIKVELTNTDGDLKMNIEEGEYKAIVNKRGYSAVDSNGKPISVISIKVDKGGYILDDIYMSKSPELNDVTKDNLKSVDSSQLQNPFKGT